MVLPVVAVLGIVWIVAGALNLLQTLDGGGAQVAPITARDTPHTVVEWLRRRDMTNDDRRAVTDKLIFEGPALRTRVARFFGLMLFSTAIATFGIQADSTAVVIGAMLVALLMTPIMATAAALLMGWPSRALRSVTLVGGGALLAIGASWIQSTYTPHIVAVGSNTQVLGRISPTLLDLLVAVAAGGAGAYAVSRSDVSDSLPGVAIAVALVPPLSVVGVSLQASQFEYAVEALLLFVTNPVRIILAAGAVFILVGYSPWFRLEAQREQIYRSFATVDRGRRRPTPSRPARLGIRDRPGPDHPTPPSGDA